MSDPNTTAPELPASLTMDSNFFLFAYFSVLFTSIIGTIINLNLLIRFLSRPAKTNGFQKICTLRSFTNSIICAAFMFWIVPLISLDFKFSELNNWVNRSLIMASCFWAYFLNALLQVCLSCNRWYFLYFPFGLQRLKNKNTSKYAIIFCVIAITIVTSGTIPEGCGFIFDPNVFLLRPEVGNCARDISNLIPVLVFSTTFITHGFNLLIIIKLIKRKSVGMNELEAKKQRKRWMVMFTQCFIQDCLQLIDILNSYYFALLSPEIWLQFSTYTLSLIVITMLDGMVMFICHSDVYPKFLKQWLKQRKGGIVVHNLSVAVTSN